MSKDIILLDSAKNESRKFNTFIDQNSGLFFSVFIYLDAFGEISKIESNPTKRPKDTERQLLHQLKEKNFKGRFFAFRPQNKRKNQHVVIYFI